MKNYKKITIACVFTALSAGLVLPSIAALKESKNISVSASESDYEIVETSFYLQAIDRTSGTLDIIVSLPEFDKSDADESAMGIREQSDVELYSSLNYFNYIQVNGVDLAGWGKTSSNGLTRASYTPINVAQPFNSVLMRYTYEGSTFTVNNVTLKKGFQLPSYGLKTGNGSKVVYQAGCDYVGTPTGGDYGWKTIGKNVKLDRIDYVQRFDGTAGYLGMHIDGADFGLKKQQIEKSKVSGFDYQDKGFITKTDNSNVKLLGNYGLFNLQNGAFGYGNYCPQIKVAPEEVKSITIPKGTLFPSLGSVIMGTNSANAGTPTILYETDADRTFVRNDDGSFTNFISTLSIDAEEVRFASWDGGTSDMLSILTDENDYPEAFTPLSASSRTQETLSYRQKIHLFDENGVAVDFTFGEAYFSLLKAKDFTVRVRGANNAEVTKIVIDRMAQLPTSTHDNQVSHLSAYGLSDEVFIKTPEEEGKLFMKQDDLIQTLFAEQFKDIDFEEYDREDSEEMYELVDTYYLAALEANTYEEIQALAIELGQLLAQYKTHDEKITEARTHALEVINSYKEEDYTIEGSNLQTLKQKATAIIILADEVDTINAVLEAFEVEVSKMKSDEEIRQPYIFLVNNVDASKYTVMIESLQAAQQKALNAINTATSYAELDAAIATFKEELAAIPTDAQLLKLAKELAVAAIEVSVDLELYQNNLRLICEAIDKAEYLVWSADSLEGVQTALQRGQELIDAVLTDDELAAKELLEFKAVGLSDVQARYDRIDFTKYSEENKNLINQKFADVKTAINNATSVKEVRDLISAFRVDVDKVPTQAKGCAGSIIASSVIITLAAVGGVTLLSLRKKKEH